MEILGALLIVGLLLLIAWLGMQWSEYKALQRAVSIANKASGFIKDLEGKKSEFPQIEMREVIVTLDMASRRGREDLNKKGSSEL